MLCGAQREKFAVETEVFNDSLTPVPDLQELIRHRAEEIYIESGRLSGHDVENWTRAEREIQELAARRQPRAAIIVKVNGVQYVGEYCPESADGYVPGEIGVGSSVAVRLEGDKMYVKRSNGKELETHIVRRSG